MNPSEKARKMFELVETWRASGQTRQQFCATHDIKVPRLAYWITRKNRHDRQVEGAAAGGFVSIASTATNKQAPQVVVSYPNGVKLELTHPDEHLIARLITLW